MKKAVATRAFTRSDTRERVRIGAILRGPASYIDELARLGSVRDVAVDDGEEEGPHTFSAPPRNPPAATGEAPQSSASPVARVSPVKTAKPSADGAKPKAKKAKAPPAA